MTTSAPQARRDRRYELDASTLEFVLPAGNRYCCATLLEISAAGAAFALDGASPVEIEVGLRVPDATIRVGSCEIRGEFVVLYTFDEPPCRTVVGAMFYPSSAGEQAMLMSLIAGIEAVRV